MTLTETRSTCPYCEWSGSPPLAARAMGNPFAGAITTAKAVHR